MSAWFSRWWKQQSRPSRAARRSRVKLQVESLEERMVMNTYLVVPTTPDNVTTFNTLQNALQAGLQPGDVVQIEPGSTPGSIFNGDIPQVKNLTIQGDPAYDVQSIPYFLTGSPVFIDSAQQGFTLKNLEIDTQQGTLEFIADGTITGCRIANEYSGISVAFQGTSAAVVRDSYFANINPANQTNSLVTFQPADGSHNRVSDNQFVNLAGSGLVLLNYAGGAGTTDLVDHNSFVSDSGLSAQLVVQKDSQGLTVQSNTFNDVTASGDGIEVSPTVENLTIADNVISLPNGGFLSDGILVDAGSPGSLTGTSSMVIANNHIHTAGQGSGIEFAGEQPPFTFVAKVQGNDLTGNSTGVLIDIGNGGSVAGIDLGGGAQGSMGGNDFRGDYDGSFWSGNRAIWVSALTAAGPIQAQANILGGDPAAAIHDYNSDPTRAAVNGSNYLGGNAAYVESLYLDFLHRTGNVNDPNDAGGWLSQLNQGMPATTVANAIARSPEALGIDVDGLYHRYLGRDADPAGRASFVAYLETGGTLEGVSQTMLASAEYASRFPTDSSFVESLYENLLHRTASSAEINGWSAALPQLGRAGVVQGFLLSQEFRDAEVNDDYSQFLRRGAAQGEVDGWVGSGLDLLSMDIYIAASPEYQISG
jgi:hypothetical protein